MKRLCSRRVTNVSMMMMMMMIDDIVIIHYIFKKLLCIGLLCNAAVMALLHAIYSRLKLFNLSQGEYVFTFVCLFNCLFVSRITQKLLN